MKKSMLKRLTAALLAASVVAAMPLSASAAWKKTGDIWQWSESGQYATGWRWLNGAWYHFNASGDMTTGWHQEDGKWYFLKESGAMAQGWVQTGDKWYCMKPNGEMQTGWVKTKGEWYYLAPNGDMATGVVQINDQVYALDESGAMQTGKVEIGGKTYTFDESGAAVGSAPAPERTFTVTKAPDGTTVAAETTKKDANGQTIVPAPDKKPGTGGGGGSSTPTPPADVVSTANFNVVTDDLNMFGKTSKELGVDFSVSGTSVSGAVYYVDDYTQWWDAANGKGYFVPLVIDPDYITDDMTIQVANKTFGKKDLESSGTFEGSLVLVYRLAENIADSLAQSLDITLNYGSGYTAKTYTLDLSKVEKITEDTEAVMGGVPYDSLKTAIESADGETVTVMKDLTTDKDEGYISVNNTVTLDLNGKTVTNGCTILDDDGTSKATHCIGILAHGNLTLKDSSTDQKGVLKAATLESGFSVRSLIECLGTFTMESGKIETVKNWYFALGVNGPSCNMTINGGSVISSWSNNDTTEGVAIAGNGNEGEAGYTLTIADDVTVEGGEFAMYLPSAGDVTIGEATVKGGKVGIEIRAGNLNLNGTTVEASAARNNSGSTKPNSTGSYTGALVIAKSAHQSENGGYKGAIDVKVNGGELKNSSGDAICIVREENEFGKTEPITVTFNGVAITGGKNIQQGFGTGEGNIDNITGLDSLDTLDGSDADTHSLDEETLDSNSTGHSPENSEDTTADSETAQETPAQGEPAGESTGEAE